MKKIGSVAEQLAFDAAIDQAQAILKGLEKPAEDTGETKGEEKPLPPKGAPRKRPEASQKLMKGVENLSAARARQRAMEADQLVELARKAGIGGDLFDEVARAAGAMKASSNDWVFAMISTHQNAAVVRWLNRNSKRPQVAVELWATLFEHMRPDTGEILQSRSELAERVGIEPRNLSSIMTELESINAIQRQQDGRRVRYFVNPNIATHIPSPAARKAARDGAGPVLVAVQGGRAADAAE